MNVIVPTLLYICLVIMIKVWNDHYIFQYPQKHTHSTIIE